MITRLWTLNGVSVFFNVASSFVIRALPAWACLILPQTTQADSITGPIVSNRVSVFEAVDVSPRVLGIAGGRVKLAAQLGIKRVDGVWVRLVPEKSARRSVRTQLRCADGQCRGRINIRGLRRVDLTPTGNTTATKELTFREYILRQYKVTFVASVRERVVRVSGGRVVIVAQ